MKIIYVDNTKSKVNYESNLKKFLTKSGLNSKDSILNQYNFCCKLFHQKFGPPEEPINKHHSVTFSSDDWKEALSLLPGDERNHISWLISVTGEDDQVVKTLELQEAGKFCFILIRNVGVNLNLVTIYLSFKNKTSDISWSQSQFDVDYQEQFYQPNHEITRQLFPQNEANQDQVSVDVSDNPHQHSIQRQNSKNQIQNMNDIQACGTPMAAPRDQNMHQFQSQGCSSPPATQSRHHNSGYLVNYRDEREFMHKKRIKDIVEYALKEMDVPQERITSRRVYDQIIDNMSSKLGHPTPHIANYENIQESQSIVPYDLRSLLPKSGLLKLLFGSDNQVGTRRGQEMTREEVVFTASKEGQCLDIGVVYLKVDVETEKVKGYFNSSTKEKKTLHCEKMTFSMPRNKVQSIASLVN